MPELNYQAIVKEAFVYLKNELVYADFSYYPLYKEEERLLKEDVEFANHIKALTEFSSNYIFIYLVKELVGLRLSKEDENKVDKIKVHVCNFGKEVVLRIEDDGKDVFFTRELVEGSDNVRHLTKLINDDDPIVVNFPDDPTLVLSKDTLLIISSILRNILNQVCLDDRGNLWVRCADKLLSLITERLEKQSSLH